MAYRKRDSLFRKPIVFDETFSGVLHHKRKGSQERYAINRAEAWETILSGGAGYNNLDWTFIPADETGSGKAPIADGRKIDGRPLREWLNIFRKLLGQYDMAALVPAVGVLPKKVTGYGYAASMDGKGQYILYFVDNKLYQQEPCERRKLEIQINLPAGRYSAQTFNPKTGSTTQLSTFRIEKSGKLNIPEFTEDIAILLTRSRINNDDIR